jgi:hypothetical protein
LDCLNVDPNTQHGQAHITQITAACYPPQLAAAGLHPAAPAAAELAEVNALPCHRTQPPQLSAHSSKAGLITQNLAAICCITDGCEQQQQQQAAAAAAAVSAKLASSHRIWPPFAASLMVASGSSSSVKKQLQFQCTVPRAVWVVLGKVPTEAGLFSNGIAFCNS